MEMKGARVNNNYLAHQDQVIASVASKATVYGWVGSVWGVVTSTDLAILAGTLVTIGGFCVAFYFNKRKNAREKLAHEADEARKEKQQEWALREHELRMLKLNKELEVLNASGK